jgi:toxin ParE1/3/4
MPDTYRIVLTDQALSDLQAIADFIRQHSPQNAASVAQKIFDAIDSLASMPARFKQVGNSQKRGTPIRSMVLRPFLIYYRVTASPRAVHILTIRHGARQPPRRID